MDPALLLGVVVVLALTAYALLGGADYGGGVWDLLASGKSAADQRTAIARAIGPIWEANHVWLILVVVVLFSAFPAAFARLSTQLHIPLMLALVGIILRGSAFMFRAYGPAEIRFQHRWGLVFAVASLMTPMLLGVVVGAITEGRLDPRAVGFFDLYVAPWTTPFAWSVGVFALVLFSFLAAVYLTVSGGSEPVIEAMRIRALVSGAATGALALTVFLLADSAPHVRSALAAMDTPLLGRARGRRPSSHGDLVGMGPGAVSISSTARRAVRCGGRSAGRDDHFSLDPRRGRGRADSVADLLVPFVHAEACPPWPLIR
jgi:cytochrome d ubiquinol oxidase subunit II